MRGRTLAGRVARHCVNLVILLPLSGLLALALFAAAVAMVAAARSLGGFEPPPWVTPLDALRGATATIAILVEFAGWPHWLDRLTIRWRAHSARLDRAFHQWLDPPRPPASAGNGAFLCEWCDATLRLPAHERRGRRGRCGQCGARVLVPLDELPPTYEEQWYVHDRGTTRGPVSVATVAGWWGASLLSRRALICNGQDRTELLFLSDLRGDTEEALRRHASRLAGLLPRPDLWGTGRCRESMRAVRVSGWALLHDAVQRYRPRRG